MRLQTLTCREGHQWKRPTKRGRPPTTCPQHRIKRDSIKVGRRAQGRYPIEEWVRRMNESDSLTYEQIGEEVGISRERVRQLLNSVAPWHPWEALRNERRALRKEVDQFRGPCKVCGELITARGRTSYCCEEHYEISNALRFVTSDETYATHRRAVARWHAEHDDDPVTKRYAERVLAGEYEATQRYTFGRGATFEAVCEAIDNDWPILSEIDPRIIKDVRSKR